MGSGPLGGVYIVRPETKHQNKPGQPLVKIPCHAHNRDHDRFLWASDTPGPDGRLGWLVNSWSPVVDIAAKVRNDAKRAELDKIPLTWDGSHERIAREKEIVWEKELIGHKPEEVDRIVRGDSSFSIHLIRAGWPHEFTLLSMTGDHACVYAHVNVEGITTLEWEGNLGAIG